MSVERERLDRANELGALAHRHAARRRVVESTPALQALKASKPIRPEPTPISPDHSASDDGDPYLFPIAVIALAVVVAAVWIIFG